MKEELTKILEGEGKEYSTLAEDFMHGEPDYWVGESRYDYIDGKSIKLDKPVPYDNTPEVLKDYTFKCVDSYGGEDCGSTYYSVYEFTKGPESIVLRFDGWYQSFHGAEFEDFYEVKPVEKKVVEYERP